MGYEIYVLIGAIIGGLEVYNHMKIKRLEDEVANFPTPEEVAKEVVKVKLPLSSLPPELADSIKQQMKADPNILGKGKTSGMYIG